MFARIYHRFFVARVATPQQKNEMVTVVVEIFDNVFGEDFPAFATVAAGLMSFDGEDVIQQ